MKTIAAVFGIFVLLGAAGLSWLRWSGLSARDRPSAIETAVARRLRSFAMPASVRELKNPVAPSEEIVLEGREHFADHCAICHGNDGRGDTQIGRGLYPKPPDMQAEATQSLSDGELFTIIQDGVRFTGMPAFGSDDPADANESWELVHFIRHLPKMTPEEFRGMEKMQHADGAHEEREFLEDGD